MSALRSSKILPLFAGPLGLCLYVMIFVTLLLLASILGGNTGSFFFVTAQYLIMLLYTALIGTANVYRLLQATETRAHRIASLLCVSVVSAYFWITSGILTPKLLSLKFGEPATVTQIIGFCIAASATVFVFRIIVSRSRAR